MVQEFKKGDVVQLNSGGAKLTVESYGKYESGEMGVTCIWIDGYGVRQSKSFPGACLRLLERPTQVSCPQHRVAKKLKRVVWREIDGVRHMVRVL
jgi:uncharacterized protein YodC (DUF2158 family)